MVTSVPPRPTRRRCRGSGRVVWTRLGCHRVTSSRRDSEYTDVPSPADDVARGPELIVARLRLGLERISGYDHELRLMVAEGDTVVTEHAETWHWHTGEQVTLPFVSVQELHDGSIVRWWDYWDLQTLMNAAPAWWMEHIMQGYT